MREKRMLKGKSVNDSERITNEEALFQGLGLGGGGYGYERAARAIS